MRQAAAAPALGRGLAGVRTMRSPRSVGQRPPGITRDGAVGRTPAACCAIWRPSIVAARHADLALDAVVMHVAAADRTDAEIPADAVGPEAARGQVIGVDVAARVGD